MRQVAAWFEVWVLNGETEMEGIRVGWPGDPDSVSEAGFETQEEAEKLLTAWKEYDPPGSYKIMKITVEEA